MGLKRWTHRKAILVKEKDGFYPIHLASGAVKGAACTTTVLVDRALTYSAIVYESLQVSSLSIPRKWNQLDILHENNLSMKYF